jgi:Zn-dependent peptidase ImmA (M78 family)
LPLDPFQILAEHPDIILIRMPLPPYDMGRWYPSERVIVLDEGLTKAEERCTLLHELVHAIGDDDVLGDCWLGGKQEMRCHARVARLLIPIDRLIAESAQAADDYQLAEALHVDLETLWVRRETLSDLELEMLADARDDEWSVA